MSDHKKHRRLRGCGSPELVDEMLQSAGCDGQVDLNVFEILLHRSDSRADRNQSRGSSSAEDPPTRKADDSTPGRHNKATK